MRWRRAGAGAPTAEDPATLLDLSTLLVVPKRVRPLEHQHAFESRKLWENVTSRLLAKEYSDATKHKHAIEQRQREKAAERKKKGEECVILSFFPSFFCFWLLRMRIGLLILPFFSIATDSSRHTLRRISTRVFPNSPQKDAKHSKTSSE